MATTINASMIHGSLEIDEQECRGPCVPRRRIYQLNLADLHRHITIIMNATLTRHISAGTQHCHPRVSGYLLPYTRDGSLSFTPASMSRDDMNGISGAQYLNPTQS
jgi:hypothetical protein